MSTAVNKLKIDPHGVEDAAVVIDEQEEQDETQEIGGKQAVVIVDDEDFHEAPKKATLPTAAVQNDDGTVTLTLSRPVKFTVKRASGKASEEVYTDLTFHELTGLDRRVVSQTPEGQQEAMLIGRATKISSARMSAIIDLLPLRDIKRIEQVITFLSE